MSAEHEKYLFDLQNRLVEALSEPPPGGLEASRVLRVYATVIAADIASRCEWNGDLLERLASAFSLFFAAGAQAAHARMTTGQRGFSDEEKRGLHNA